MNEDDEHRIVRAGQTSTIPVGARHLQLNPCEREAVVIEEIRPGGRIHDFFRVLFGRRMPPFLLGRLDISPGPR